ncbi:MAG TPA: hypothetical protein VF541_14125 [Longimicrobium sp.]|jgi:hypothetical protein
MRIHHPTLRAAPRWRWTGDRGQGTFYIQVEGQPIGRFAHQVMMRDRGPSSPGPLRWRRVRGNRFVPVGDPNSAGFFVEWRREGGRWVVSAFGDESFGEGPLPPWCC